MKLHTPVLAATVAAALCLAGCASEPAAAPPSASTMSPTPAATNMSAASPMKGMPVMTDGMPDKEASHMPIEDTPVFLTMPGPGVAPIGILKSGTKVLAMVPGSTYTKCMMGGNKAVYLKTASLKPTTN